MRRSRRNHSPECKARVALAAVRCAFSLAEWVKKRDAHANQISAWKKQLLKVASDLSGKSVRKAEASEQTVQALHARIGQLAMEHDFLERGLRRIHGLRGKTGAPQSTVVPHSPMRRVGYAPLYVLSQALTGLGRGA